MSSKIGLMFLFVMLSYLHAASSGNALKISLQITTDCIVVDDFKVFIETIQADDLDALKKMISTYGNPNICDQEGNTLLMVAVQFAKPGIVEYLLSFEDINILAKNTLGQSALILSYTEEKNVEDVDALVTCRDLITSYVSKPEFDVKSDVSVVGRRTMSVPPETVQVDPNSPRHSLSSSSDKKKFDEDSFKDEFMEQDLLKRDFPAEDSLTLYGVLKFK